MKKCVPGYKSVGGVCTLCIDPDCVSCLRDIDTCFGCLPFHGVLDNECVECIDRNCLNCDLDPYSCRNCTNGLAADRHTGSCVRCTLPGCATCDSADHHSCLWCVPGWNQVLRQDGKTCTCKKARP